MQICVQLCIETVCKRATSVAHLTNFSFEFFMKLSQKMPVSVTSSISWCKVKMTKNSNQGGPDLRGGGGAGPLFKAILVNFGRRASIFFVWKLLEKYEKWHHFCAHAQWWSPSRRKNVEKGHLGSVEFNFYINCDRQKRFSQNERRRVDLQNLASDFIIFARNFVMVFQNLATILPPFSDFERP